MAVDGDHVVFELETDAIPTLDFGAGFNLPEEDPNRHQLCDSLVDSLKRHGLAKLENHGVSPAAIASAFDLSERFFGLSADEKAVAAHPDGPNPHRGYCHVGLERTYGVTGFERGVARARKVLDIKESFDIGDKSDTMFLNRWPAPESLPVFRASMEAFFDECHASLCNIMDAVALGLGLEPRSLAALHSSKNHELRLLHYPAVDANLLDGSRLRIAEHTDFGTITLLFQDTVGGLEVEAQHYLRTQNAETAGTTTFRAIKDPAPVMIVNIGDSLERWTNSHLRAVVHRVSRANDRDARPAQMLPDRYSIAFFGKPNRDVSLLPFKEMVGEGRPALWDDITAHVYNQSKLVRTFAQD